MISRPVLVNLWGVLIVILCGCNALPPPYAPPQQQPFFEVPPEVTRLLQMADSDAPDHFVQDIEPNLEADTWRWTGKRPTIRLYQASNQRLSYAIDFAIPGSTLAQTGPVTVSFFVNNHLLDRARYTAPGRQRVEKPVPTEWVQPNENVILAAEVDKVWTPPQRDGKPLGFILVALGLEQKLEQKSEQK